MTVVTIIGVVSAVGFHSLASTGKSTDAASLARSLQFLAMRARQETASDNRQRRISCALSAAGSTCQYFMAQTPGAGVSAAWNLLDTLAAGSHATLWNATGTVDVAANNAGSAQAITTAVITFYPDGTVTGPAGGSASGATLYVCDKTQTNRYKVYVYGGSGMSRLVGNW